MSLHPLFRVALHHPDLIADHLANHVEHAKAQAADAVRSMGLKVAGAAVAVVALLIALNLTGIAVMLAATQAGVPAALWWVPGIAWAVALAGGLMAWRASLRDEVREVKDEFQADAQMLALIKEARS
ncbi:hypothetical protein PGB34_06550 [Xenophilus arseniciresistens]|uniref:Phage holin family protein n=1 Tax=Xenophilus arseniciresistens TaxID=1283306 RepID=A0AAE3N8Z5_9BURK|nr:hypothetical protein [Xenophilus arseniciresistens]MDA7416022.1 hypothetical protein [Xenophilus arseniciresistens]